MIASRRDAYLLVAVAIVAVIAGYWLLLLSPARSAQSAAAERRDTAQTALIAAKTDLSRQRAAQQDASAGEVQLRSAAKAVPADAQQAGLVLVVSDLAEQAGVNFTALTPGVPTVVGSGAIGTPSDLTFTGRYADLDDLLFRLQRLVTSRSRGIEITGRLVTLQKVIYEPSVAAASGQVASGSASGDLKATVTLTTYNVDPTATAASPVGSVPGDPNQSTATPATTTSGVTR